MSIRLFTDIILGFIFLLGLAIGSFVNVLVYRVPRKEPFGVERSKCPECGQVIRAYDNIPLISFLVLRGKCRRCGRPISWRYPAVELLTGLLFVGVGIVYLDVLTFGYSQALTLTAYWTFMAILVGVAFIDAEHQLIPNRLTYPGIVAGAVLLVAAHPDKALFYLAGFVVGGGMLLLVALIKAEGMGGGDIKLAAMLGVYLGLNVLLALFIGFLTGAALGVILRLVRKRSLKEPMAFGPFLALGGIVTFFVGQPIINWYISLFAK